MSSDPLDQPLETASGDRRPASGEGSGGQRRMPWWGGPRLFYLTAGLILALDQATKWWILRHFWLTVPHCYLPKLYGLTICLTHVQNAGAAFSILLGQRWTLTIVAGAVAIGLILYERRLPVPRPLLKTLGLALLLAGTLGNLIDRSRFGHVIDFLDLRYLGKNIFPIFNVADIAINVGVALLVLRYLFGVAAREEIHPLLDARVKEET